MRNFIPEYVTGFGAFFSVCKTEIAGQWQDLEISLSTFIKKVAEKLPIDANYGDYFSRRYCSNLSSKFSVVSKC